MEWIWIIPEESGERIDALLPRYVEGLSRARAQKLLEQGAVTLGETEIVKKNRPVTAGERYLLRLPEVESAVPQPQDIPLDVAYEDSDLIVVNKPRGMVVHPAPGHTDGTLVNALLFHCAGELSGVGGVARPGIVHRIDRDTSGLLVAAKNDFTHLGLSAQLADRSLGRVYYGVVYGCPREPEGTVDAPIGRCPTDRKRMAVVPGGRRAVTHYRLAEPLRGFSLLEFRLETGRTHQIRVHMEHIGHPLAGDLVYGRKRPEHGLSGQCLHAAELHFRHPRTGEAISCTAPLPAYFTGFLAKVR